MSAALEWPTLERFRTLRGRGRGEPTCGLGARLFPGRPLPEAELLVGVLVALDERLPTSPPLAAPARRIIELSRADDPRTSDYLAVIEPDEELTELVLDAANAPFFEALSGRGGLEQALVRAGLRHVEQLALAHGLARRTRGFGRFASRARGLVAASVATAIVSRLVGARFEVLGTDSFLAGLLHRLGELELLRLLERLEEESCCPLSEDLTDQVLEANGDEAFTRLSEAWGLPAEIREAVLGHRDPARAAETPLTAAVHLGRQLSRSLDTSALGPGLDPEDPVAKAQGVETAELESALFEAIVELEGFRIFSRR